jgi:hypothetical protein
MAIGINFDDKAHAVYFAPTGAGYEYVCGLDEMDYIEFMNTYEDGPNGVRRKRTQGINLDGTEKAFFAVAVADCHDPPVTIVRADNEQEAEERFIEESPAEWITDETTLEEMGEDVSCDGDGHPYDSSGVHVWPVRLLRIDVIGQEVK